MPDRAVSPLAGRHSGKGAEAGAVRREIVQVVAGEVYRDPRVSEVLDMYGYVPYSLIRELAGQEGGHCAQDRYGYCGEACPARTA